MHILDYVISCFCNDAAIFHDGELFACQVKATQSILKNIYPNPVKQLTKNTNDKALHCLLSSRPSTNQEIKKTVTYMVDKSIVFSPKS